MNKSELATDLLSSFNTHFAKAQNHHQRLFLQFIVTIFIAIAAFAIVFINTAPGAHFFESIATREGATGYSVLHLVVSYFISQAVLTALCLVILNIGYSFRRDQRVSYNIRMFALSSKMYHQIFEDKAFKGFNLGRRSYLPTFNSIFYLTIVVIQILLCIVMWVAAAKLRNYEMDWLGWGFIIFFLIPPAVSLYFHDWFFRKYRQTVCDTQG